MQVKGLEVHVARTAGQPANSPNHFADGQFVTLRLKSSMYHRFHAPHDCRVERVTYFHGDVWNVNPPDAQARRSAVLPQRARGHAGAPGIRQHSRRAGAGWRHSGGQHPAAFSRYDAAHELRRAERSQLRRAHRARARRWAGSSTARPSSSSLRLASRLSTPFAKATCCEWANR